MSIDPAVIGTELPPVTMDLERGRLRWFAQVIGETDPVYLDVDAARAAGHPDLPAPPTFLFAISCAIDCEPTDLVGWLDDIGVDLRTVLHGEQRFVYHAMAYAGDRLTARSHIADVYAKKGGALEFLVRQTAVANAAGTLVAELTDVLVVRQPEVA